MLGLMFIVGIGSLVLLVALAMWAAKRISLKAGQSPAAAQRWKYGVLAAVLLTIFWDWLPTWIAYEYYSREAGFTVIKTLEQWKVENPGVAETLEAYGKTADDLRDDPVPLPHEWNRHRLNARFAYDERREQVLLSVRTWTFQLVDVGTGDVMARFIHVASGSSGGIARGGKGWLKFWLIYGEPLLSAIGYDEWERYREAASNIGGEYGDQQ